MSWFAIRLGPGEHRRFYVQQESYPTREAAEQVAWDNDRLINKSLSLVDESIPPFIVEGTDIRDAIFRWSCEWAEHNPPREYGKGAP